MDSSPVIEYRNKMLDWRHLLSQNPRQYQACYAPQSGSGLDIDVNSEESNQADQCRYPRPERRYSLCRNCGTAVPEYPRMKLEYRIRRCNYKIFKKAKDKGKHRELIVIWGSWEK